MDTLRGDGAGTVVELSATVSQPWRCEYMDSNGQRCKNDKSPGLSCCLICEKLLALQMGQETGSAEKSRGLVWPGGCPDPPLL